MSSLQQNFSDAKALHSADELLFLTLIEKFEELKKILESNFLQKHKTTKWYGKSEWVVTPAIKVELEDKISHNTGKYIFIKINSVGYVMGIGQFGELKDKIYFCEGFLSSSNKTNKTNVYITDHMFGSNYYFLENHITCVQLFSYLIKKFNYYLIKND